MTSEYWGSATPEYCSAGLSVPVSASAGLSASMFSMRRIAPSAIVRFTVAVLAVAALVIATAGCGGGESGDQARKTPPERVSPGEKIFTSEGCSGCHTLEAAGATGKVGPNLDELRPNQQAVARQVRTAATGCLVRGQADPAEINQVAAFVSTAAGTGRAGKISFEPNDQKVDDCQDTTCYEQAFGNLAYDEGPKAALQKLAQLSSTTARRSGLPPDRTQDTASAATVSRPAASGSMPAPARAPAEPPGQPLQPAKTILAPPKPGGTPLRARLEGASASPGFIFESPIDSEPYHRLTKVARRVRMRQDARPRRRPVVGPRFAPAQRHERGSEGLRTTWALSS